MSQINNFSKLPSESIESALATIQTGELPEYSFDEMEARKELSQNQTIKLSQN